MFFVNLVARAGYGYNIDTQTDTQKFSKNQFFELRANPKKTFPPKTLNRFVCKITLFMLILLNR